MKMRACLSYSVLLAMGSFFMALSVLSCASPPSRVPDGIPEFPGSRDAEPAPPELPPEEAVPVPSFEDAEDIPGLLLAFDDDHGEIWERYFDLLDRYGARVTFFVQGDYSSFCAAAVSRGHEIGYHTKSHPNLLKVPQQVFFEETIAGAEALRQRGLSLRSFAYPYGFFEPWMEEVLGKSFSIRRGFSATCRIYSVYAIKAGYVSSKSIDNIRYKDDAEFEADIRDMLEGIQSNGGILPLTTHTIAADADWGINPERLEYLLKTAAELGLQFYRYGDFFVNPP